MRLPERARAAARARRRAGARPPAATDHQPELEPDERAARARGPRRAAPRRRHHAVHDELADLGDARRQQRGDERERADEERALAVRLPHEPQRPGHLPEDDAHALQPFAQRRARAARRRRRQGWERAAGTAPAITQARREIDGTRARFLRRAGVNQRAMNIPERRSDATTAMAPSDWSIDRATQFYNIAGWGAGFFSVNEQACCCST